MSILLVGLNHRTAPVQIREQLAFSRDGIATALILFRNQFPRAEAAIISTCNRVEVLVASDGDSPTPQDVVTFIAQARDLPVNLFRQYLYQLSGEQACRHFFRVASGLDSMVLGENQIVNQIKAAYAQASEQGTTGRTLNRLFHHAFEVSKRVRTETQIGAGKLSVPSVAVDVARRIFDDFSTKQTLVVGAGEMAQLVCQYLREADAKRFVVTTRSHINAKALAEACQGQAVPWDQLDAQLIQADIVITATACPMPIITPERIREAQKHRRGRLLFLIDLAVPRNVDPEVGKLEQVYLIDIDELGRMVAENQKLRNGQLEACERILDEEVAAFEQWLDSTRLNPLIEQMFKDARQLRDAELERLYRRCPDLDPQQRRAIEQLVDRLVGKFMHPCVSALRRHSAGASTLAGALREAARRQ
ncbi:glutamyl-tRNA reductase [Fontivita pretiosa]|uniref:glutamyl-tRNA reductase n=1 Tax=Fontivita pretiosa TaxID=2989684 RepID=UPI003D16438E